MIIAEVMEMHPDWPYFDDAKKDGFPAQAPYTVEEVTELYKKASARCKEDEKAREKARIITAKFQDGHPGYRALWQHLRDVSVDAVKANYDELDVNFDLWLGESDAHQTCYRIMDIAREKGILEKDDGAEIIRLEAGAKPSLRLFWKSPTAVLPMPRPTLPRLKCGLTTSKPKKLFM